MQMLRSGLREEEAQEQALKATVASLGLRNVVFFGALTHQQLAMILDQCDILVNASRVDNFPGALLEASGAGLVVVSTNPGGIPFLYQHDHNAILVEPGDVIGLAHGINRVVQLQNKAIELAERGAALARSCYWREVRKQLYQAYGFQLPQEDTHGVSAGA